MTRTEFYTRYADVVAHIGLNIQREQEVFVAAPIEAAEFLPYFARAAYRRGAQHVHVEYRQQAVTRTRLEEAYAESLSYVPPGRFAERLRVAQSGGAYLGILGEDPMGMAGIEANRREPWARAVAEAREEIRTLTMANRFPWCIVSMPNPAWARAVFPERSEASALDALFDAVARVCRLDTDDPLSAWRAHSDELSSIATWLTDQAFDRFHYRSPGTDLTIGMPAHQRWIGTGSRSAEGVEFIANLPTDEVFCAPDRRRVEGRVRSTRPIVVSGVNLGTAEFIVRDGRIVEAHCEGDEAVLLQELDLDDRARYFGEIALVTQDAPIARLGTTFFDTLYDENAGCHLAFGAAYPGCVEGGTAMDDEAKGEAGLNVSGQHLDFTVGSDELMITATRVDGTTFPLMVGGRWSDELADAVSRAGRGG
ncbi:MAG: aminopeptidase [Spirochaetales bacterium]|nr:aminopeptidase [Spirochaetales bacterium]